jgi:hypothetical protein
MIGMGGSKILSAVSNGIAANQRPQELKEESNEKGDLRATYTSAGGSDGGRLGRDDGDLDEPHLECYGHYSDYTEDLRGSQ